MSRLAVNTENNLVKLYQSMDEDGVITSKYKYLPGSPKNYRFDGRTGDFNLGGVKPLGKKFTLQPISFRFMEDSLFARKSDSTGEMKRELWCEIFFIDDNNAVSYIIFNNSSARSLQGLIKSVFYEDIIENGVERSMQITDLVLTITGEKKENDKGKYFVANFDYVEADKASVQEYKELCQDVAIFSRDTIQDTADVILFSRSYPASILPVSANQTLLLEREFEADING